MASQRVPNITTMSPDVGGTVDSQNKPSTAPKTRVTTVLGGSIMYRRMAIARPNERQHVALGQIIGEPPGADRSHDIEEADNAKRPPAGRGWQAAVDQIGRQMHGDEENLAAGEEAKHEQYVAAMPQRLRQSLRKRLMCAPTARVQLRGIASASESGMISSTVGREMRKPLHLRAHVAEHHRRAVRLLGFHLGRR